MSNVRAHQIAVLKMQPTHHTVPPEVLAAIDRGNKIEAIKLLRDATGLGLKEAKDAVEQIEAGGSLVLAQKTTKATGSEGITSALQQGNKLEAIRLYREQKGVELKEAKDAIEAMLEGQQITASGLSPGEVKSSAGLMWFAVALVVGVVAAYFYFRQS
jgi:ribosomal protein L7/L12